MAIVGIGYRVDLGNIIGDICDGDPPKEPILQLADFFAYTTQIRYNTDGKLKRRRDIVWKRHCNIGGSYHKSVACCIIRRAHRQNQMSGGCSRLAARVRRCR